MTGCGRHLFELNGAETSLNIISTKGFKSTWWMLISHSIYTDPITSLVSKKLLITRWRFLCMRWHNNNKLIEISTHQELRQVIVSDAMVAIWIRISQLIKWNTAASPESSLGSTFPLLPCLLTVIPCQLATFYSCPSLPLNPHKTT